MDKCVEIILEYAKELVKQNVVGTTDCISVRSGDELYATAIGVPLASLQEADVVKVPLAEAQGEYALHAQIYASKEEVRAICHCHPAWVEPIAACGGKSGAAPAPAAEAAPAPAPAK